MSPSRFDLSGKVAVVTGALGKLGPVWIGALLEAGARVAGVDLERTNIDERYAALERAVGPDRLPLIRADVTDRSSLEAALSKCRAELGEPDILVNNAGIDQPPGPAITEVLEHIPVDTLRAVFAVNVGGTFLATQVFGGAMVARGHGSIVNIGSIYASLSPDPRLYDHIPVDPPFLKPPGYGPSKAAVVNLTRYFAVHWARQGIRVNVLSPGGVAGGQDPQFVSKFSSRVPLGRLAREEDLGGPLTFLASDASSYVTGTELKVDGGYSIW